MGAQSSAEPLRSTSGLSVCIDNDRLTEPGPYREYRICVTFEATPGTSGGDIHNLMPYALHCVVEPVQDVRLSMRHCHARGSFGCSQSSEVAREGT